VNIDFLIKKFKKCLNDEAIIFDDKIYHYSDILTLIDGWTEIIKNNKIAPGMVIAITGDYSPDAIAVIIALIVNKNIIVPLSTLAEVHYDEYFNTSQTQYVINLSGQNYSIIKKNGVPRNNKILNKLIELSHPGLILFTSGSSGKPKAVLHDFDKLMSKYIQPSKKHRTLCFLMFDHIAGIDTYFYCLFSGGTIIFPVSRNPGNICQLIEEHKVEVLPTSPTFLNLLLISEAYKKYDLSALKIITFGSERIPKSLLNRLEEIFDSVRLIQKYGVTELGSPPSKTRKENSTWIKIDSKQFKTKIINNILHIKSETAMIGYLNAPNPFTEDGWFNTGDSVDMDGEYIRIIGRSSEIINVGGEKVYPSEVESIIQEIRNVAEASVYGERNLITGEIVCTKVRLITDEDPKEFIRRLKKYCRDHLETYKIPVKVDITNDELYNNRYKKIKTI
jgi:long-chain acyl-CoA synthetase